jgi:hypothetical protein
MFFAKNCHRFDLAIKSRISLVQNAYEFRHRTWTREEKVSYDLCNSLNAGEQMKEPKITFAIIVSITIIATSSMAFEYNKDDLLVDKFYLPCLN